MGPNYFGMPARGKLSSPGTNSEEIMVNLAWEYTNEIEAEDANNKILFLMQYLGIKSAQPDIIRNWDI